MLLRCKARQQQQQQHQLQLATAGAAPTGARPLGTLLALFGGQYLCRFAAWVANTFYSQTQTAHLHSKQLQLLALLIRGSDCFMSCLPAWPNVRIMFMVRHIKNKKRKTTTILSSIIASDS